MFCKGFIGLDDVQKTVAPWSRVNVFLLSSSYVIHVVGSFCDIFPWFARLEEGLPICERVSTSRVDARASSLGRVQCRVTRAGSARAFLGYR
jgi:hypothetical protein